ncbi:acylneuraminate cytidylyltransferase family protein [bacterium]|nr:acylneuraminate cytidylyltransferase family protein [bacterium]
MKKKQILNIVCIIPARGGSKEIPGKNLMNFCGKPLIVWSIEQAKASKYIKKIYVSSDDAKILKVSGKASAEIIKRPKKLATDISSSEQALLHAMSYIKKFNKETIDIIVFLQATSPLRTSEDIDKAIKLFISKKADSLFSAAALEDFCIWSNQDKKLTSLSYNYQNRGNRQNRQPLYLENGSIYIFKPSILEKFNNRFGGKIEMYIMDYWKSFEIDKLKDIEICEYFMQKIFHTKKLLKK